MLPSEFEQRCSYSEFVELLAYEQTVAEYREFELKKASNNGNR